MKLTNYFFIFTVIFSLLVLLLFYSTNINVKMDEEDQKYREYLYEATQSALQETVDNISESSYNDVLWTKETMSIAYNKLLDQFNMLLDYPMNTDTIDTTEYLFPLICYIDNDGFYITYVGTNEDATASNKRVTSPINTGTTTIDGYSIRYYLDNETLTVTDCNGKTQTGSYDYINRVFDNPSFLADIDAFNKNKNEFIITETEKQLNYYINNKDTSVNQYGKNYTLSLDISNDEVHKMFTQPGLAVFMQGPSVNNTYDHVTIFGYAQHQIKKISAFPVTTDGLNVWYHKNKGCEKINEQDCLGYVYSKKDAAENNIAECTTCFQH